MQSPVSNVYAFGLLVKSWATGLNYFTNPTPASVPTAAIPAGTPWALPALGALFVPVAGSATPASVSAVAMSWDTFAGILHDANNAVPVGVISNPTGTVTSVVIVQGDNTTMVLRLPPKLKLQQSEQALLTPGTAYGIPTFYNGLYNDPVTGAPPATPVMPANSTGILQLHANRIGDYTMSLCA